jgi:hypothetical protein
LVEDEPWVFELVIQWLFTGTVVLSLTRLVTKLKDRKEERKRVKAANEAKVTGYLAFLTLCDKLLLREDCGEDIVGKIKDCLVVCSDALQSEHLVAAARLPSGHAVRRLFAEATVKDFVLAKKRRKPFRFETELKELEGYAADLLFACGGIFRDCYTTEDTGGLHLASRDPFTNQYFLVKVNK